MTGSLPAKVGVVIVMSYKELLNMKNNLLLYRFLSGSALKIIAVVSMTIDHVAYYILNQQLGLGDCWIYEVMRCMGRLAFPIFAFLIIEGYHHTRHIGKYILALLVTALVSEIPWQLLGNEGSHNVVFTLLLGLIAAFLVDHIHDAPWLMLMETVLIAVIATFLNVDYSWHGICLMMVFYLFREHRGLTLLFGFPLMMEYGIVGSAIGLIIPLMYSGRRGFVKGQWMKYLFYMYYPLHLLVIYLCIIWS